MKGLRLGRKKPDLAEKPSRLSRKKPDVVEEAKPSKKPDLRTGG
jgi:hypothetical protein